MASQPSVSEEIDYLKQQIQDLQQEVADRQNDAELAAKIGKQLMEANNEISQQLQTVCNDKATCVEALEQEKYCLQRKVEQMGKVEQNYLDEIKELQQSLQKTKDNHQTVVETQHQAQVAELRKQVSALDSEVSKAALTEKQQKERCIQLEMQLSDVQEQLKHQLDKLNETNSEDVANMYQELRVLSEHKMALESSHSEVTQQLQQMKLHVEQLTSSLSEKDKEVEEKECQATAYFNALEREREEVRELKMEVDLLRMETQDQKSKGNSLFSEVEDRRVQAEKEVITMRVQLDTKEKQYDITKQQLQRLKMQVAPLLQMSRGKATDQNYIESLRSQLSKARSEAEILQQKLTSSEKTKQVLPSGDSKQLDQTGVSKADPSYATFLEALLENTKKELEDLKTEYKTKQLTTNWSTQKLIEAQRRIYELESVENSLQANNIQLKLKVEELQVKYEPEKCNKLKKKKVPTATLR